MQQSIAWHLNIDLMKLISENIGSRELVKEKLI
jgi:hypothetical protein